MSIVSAVAPASARQRVARRHDGRDRAGGDEAGTSGSTCAERVGADIAERCRCRSGSARWNERPLAGAAPYWPSPKRRNAVPSRSISTTKPGVRSSSSSRSARLRPGHAAYRPRTAIVAASAGVLAHRRGRKRRGRLSGVVAAREGQRTRPAARERRTARGATHRRAATAAGAARDRRWAVAAAPCRAPPSRG